MIYSPIKSFKLEIDVQLIWTRGSYPRIYKMKDITTVFCCWGIVVTLDTVKTTVVPIWLLAGVYLTVAACYGKTSVLCSDLIEVLMVKLKDWMIVYREEIRSFVDGEGIRLEITEDTIGEPKLPFFLPFLQLNPDFLCLDEFTNHKIEYCWFCNLL